MLTSKQRSKLKALAANITPIEKRELIKINILENADGEPQILGRELAEKLNAECVIVIGRKAVLYRKSKRKDIDHISL